MDISGPRFDGVMNTPRIVPDLTRRADSIAVELRSVTKDYHTAAGPFRALKDVDLDVRRGEFLAVVGRSGSGKSTLMNMITGIDHPSGGEVHVAGTRVDELPESAMAEWRGRDVGIVAIREQVVHIAPHAIEHRRVRARIERPAARENGRIDLGRFLTPCA